MSNNLPKKCPSCGENLIVKSLECKNCQTSVSGEFSLPILALLTEEDRDFILKFIKHSGSLKKMAKEMELSYPTVRNILNNVIENVKELEQEVSGGQNAK